MAVGILDNISNKATPDKVFNICISIIKTLVSQESWLRRLMG